MSELLRAVNWDKTAGNFSSKTQDLNDPYVRLSVNLVDEEVNGIGELLDSFRKGDVKGTLDGCADALKVVCQLVYSLDVCPEELLREINISNFSKFCYTREDAERSVMKYECSEDYKGVFYEVVNGHYVIKGFKLSQNVLTDTPKVLKGVNYREPDLSRFIKDGTNV